MGMYTNFNLFYDVDKAPGLSQIDKEEIVKSGRIGCGACGYDIKIGDVKNGEHPGFWIGYDGTQPTPICRKCASILHKVEVRINGEMRVFLHYKSNNFHRDNVDPSSLTNFLGETVFDKMIMVCADRSWNYYHGGTMFYARATLDGEVWAGKFYLSNQSMTKYIYMKRTKLKNIDQGVDKIRKLREKRIEKKHGKD